VSEIRKSLRRSYMRLVGRTTEMSSMSSGISQNSQWRRRRDVRRQSVLRSGRKRRPEQLGCRWLDEGVRVKFLEASQAFWLKTLATPPRTSHFDKVDSIDLFGNSGPYIARLREPTNARSGYLLLNGGAPSYCGADSSSFCARAVKIERCNEKVASSVSFQMKHFICVFFCVSVRLIFRRTQRA